ncbi:MAG: putative addiction module antidote protein [Betaproteobacteria bacterium]|nr:putative addiction module antidote protein [Betaproteobacteria bacterium]NBT69171.1 putative addiction module antidote protein [Betaproteobacteria bacterium]
MQSLQHAAEFLNAASEDDDPKTYLTALRKVVEARGGMATVAQKTDLSRETLYRTLSSRGNPTIRTLNAVYADSVGKSCCAGATGSVRYHFFVLQAWLPLAS